MRTDDGTRQKFYPTSALVTGPDIIFLWVARMLIAGLHFKPNGERQTEAETLEANLAFKDVYFTGLIRDKQGRKLSKSLGNSPDPLDLIAKYGADGLRFGLVRIAPQGADIRFDEKQIEEGRNFCNKLWNICRFRTMQGADRSQRRAVRSIRAPSSPTNCSTASTSCSKANATPSPRSSQFNFSEAASAALRFRLERIRRALRRGRQERFRPGRFPHPRRHARHVRLRHEPRPAPAPSLRAVRDRGTLVRTRLRHRNDPDHAWPTQSPRPKDVVAARAGDLQHRRCRAASCAAKSNCPPTRKFPSLLVTPRASPSPTIRQPCSPRFSMPPKCRCSPRRRQIPAPKLSRRSANSICPPPASSIPPSKSDRLTKELAKVEKDLEQTRRKLGDANMLAKAPPAKVEEWRALEISLAEKEKSLQESLSRLKLQKPVILSLSHTHVAGSVQFSMMGKWDGITE